MSKQLYLPTTSHMTPLDVRCYEGLVHSNAICTEHGLTQAVELHQAI